METKAADPEQMETSDTVDAMGDAWFEGAEAEPAKALWLMPVLLLYTGFFLGPIFTFLTALMIARSQLRPREALILFGTSGAIWCLIGGFTAVYGGVLGWEERQAGRAILNLIGGAVAYYYVRQAVRDQVVIPRTLYLTVGFAVILVAMFFVLPPQLGLLLGR